MTISSKSSILISWKEEKDSAYLYKKIVLKEINPSRKKLFHRLAETAEHQAKLWEEKLSKKNISVPQYSPSFRTQLVGELITFFGPQKLKSILSAMKVRGLSVYLGEVPGYPETLEIVPEPQHRIIQQGVAIRAAVFGVNDGLVSNASLILGVAAASSNTSIIILSGIAGLCAGAFSMAAGEYISMRSQRELFEYQIALERAELEEYPEEEIAELSYIYQARGLSKPDADTFARKILANKEHGLKTLAREELGLNPDELGSPWVAAISSFITFAIGGLVPLLPYFFIHASHLSLLITIVLTGLALFIVGVTLSLFTGQNALYSGFRMLLIGGLAGLTTYGIGKWVGVNI